MPKRISIAPHLTPDELEQRYRQATQTLERSHYQIIWLLSKGKRSEEVVEVTGYSCDWIYELVRSYNRQGVEALGDLRRHNPGALSKLDDVQQANLLQALRGPAPDGGLWNGRKVADYLSQLLGVSISRQQGWEYLKQMEFRLRVPRPQHQEADIEAQEAWKKKLQDEVERIQQAYPDATVEIWCEDEHRIGLQPVTRQVWTQAGESPATTLPKSTHPSNSKTSLRTDNLEYGWVDLGRSTLAPMATVNWKREWLWLYAFVQPQTGETYWWILKRSRRAEYSVRRTRAPTSTPSCSAVSCKILPNISGSVRTSE